MDRFWIFSNQYSIKKWKAFFLFTHFFCLISIKFNKQETLQDLIVLFDRYHNNTALTGFSLICFICLIRNQKYGNGTLTRNTFKTSLAVKIKQHDLTNTKQHQRSNCTNSQLTIKLTNKHVLKNHITHNHNHQWSIPHQSSNKQKPNQWS